MPAPAPQTVRPGVGRPRASALAVTAAVGLVAWTALALAVTLGWLGPDTDRGANFCEADHAGPLAQPVNALSNLGFLVAGLLVARRARRGPLDPSTATAYAVLVVLLGPGSAAMHATESALGGWLDTTSMYLFASFTAAFAIARVAGAGRRTAVLLFVVLLAGSLVVDRIPATVPLVHTPGNLVFAALLWLTLALEAVVARRRRTSARWGLASLGVLAVAFAIWTTAQDGSPWCDPSSWWQGHGAWHLLDAGAAYLLFRHYEAGASARGGPARG